MYLLGYLSSRITYDDQARRWTMTDLQFNISAESKASKVSYALGKNNWTIHDDAYECNEGQTYSRVLKLSGCSDDQFTCDDAQCVRMEERCDQIPNCRDDSDEKGCNLLVLKESYNKRVAPITTVSATNFTLVPVPVNVSIWFMKVVTMEEIEHSIYFQFEIILEWKDNRITFHNLKEDSSLNALSDEEISQLWLPLVIYANTDQKESTRLGMLFEWSTSITIAR